MPAKAFFSVGSGAGTYFWMASTRVNTRNPAYRDIDALIDSERRFRLLVEGVIDYAIYMLDPNGIVTNWNAGAQRIKGYAPDEIIGQHFCIFYTPEERAAGRPAEALATALREGKYRGRRLARPQGRHALLRVGGDRSALRGGRPGRLRQDHPRHHRAGGGAECAAGQRAQLPAPGQRCHRLRALHARSGGTRVELERRRRTDQGLHADGNHRPAFLALLHRRRTRPPAARHGRCRLHARPAATRRKAGACARMARFSGPAW